MTQVLRTLRLRHAKKNPESPKSALPFGLPKRGSWRFCRPLGNEAQASLSPPDTKNRISRLNVVFLESLTITETVDGSARDVATRPPFGRWPVSVEELEGR
jgi:hypothetical protein